MAAEQSDLMSTEDLAGSQYCWSMMCMAFSSFHVMCWPSRCSALQMPKASCPSLELRPQPVGEASDQTVIVLGGALQGASPARLWGCLHHLSACLMGCVKVIDALFSGL